MTKWHLALALAAGQVIGRIESTEGRVFLIKGDTFKKKERSVNTEVDEKGNVSETITMLDKFVPVINADRKSTRLNSSHSDRSRMPSSA